MDRKQKALSSRKANSNSLRKQVYSDLRMAILTGRIAPGTRLVESALAVEMGVSRTPIREALHKLDLEELVHSIPRVGYMVNDMTEYEIEDLFTTRTAIEQLAARWALEKITPEEIERIENNLKKADRILKNGMTGKMIDLDTEFHEIICKASRSKRLYQISQMLREHMLKFRIACLHLPEIAKRSRDGHFEILKALKSKDPRKTDNSILQHMLITKKDIMDYMKRVREELL